MFTKRKKNIIVFNLLGNRNVLTHEFKHLFQGMYRKCINVVCINSCVETFLLPNVYIIYIVIHGSSSSHVILYMRTVIIECDKRKLKNNFADLFCDRIRSWNKKEKDLKNCDISLYIYRCTEQIFCKLNGVLFCNKSCRHLFK